MSYKCCNKYVMNTRIPGIKFDKNGVCNYCHLHVEMEKSYPIDQYVEFTGFGSDSELIKWYQKAKVICQLSYYDSFGLVPAEGMDVVCIPVVTKKCNG